jgi:predicted amidohydrolase YtcJ
MATSNDAPDFILHGGNIVTLDDALPSIEAVAVRDGYIQAVGDNKTILTSATAATEVIDLGGWTMVPGFNDVHAHMDREGLKQLRPSLAEAHSVNDVLRIISETARRTPAGEWIVTMPVGVPPHYFDGPRTLAEGRMPTRQELDRAAPDHPVCIGAVFGNWGEPPGFTALNSHGLALNGIDRVAAPRCKGVEIQRDVDGEPNGIIVEHNARPTVDFDLLPALPRFGYSDRLEGLRRSMALYNTVGTTSVYEGHGSAAETIAAYRELWERGEMTLRAALVLSPAWRDLAEAKTAIRDWLAVARGRGMGDPWLTVSGVHIAIGGDPLVAELARADLPNTGWSGFVEQANTLNEFRDYCMLAAEHDLRINTIVGDHLADVLPVLETVNEKFPLAGRRWVVEHVARTTKNDLQRLHLLGVFVTTIPVYYLWKGGARYVDDPDGGESVVPHRTMLDLGIPTSAGTDNIPYDPFFTLWSIATRHERHENRVLGPGQQLSGTEALKLMTREGAWLSFDEKRKGRLAPGHFADMAVLSDNPCCIDPEELKALTCHLTIVGGRIVYRNV